MNAPTLLPFRYVHDPAPSCKWSALCDHDAVGTMPHPVLGHVHICQRCADKVAAIDSVSR